mgnify:CR=1 FL=1
MQKNMAMLCRLLLDEMAGATVNRELATMSTELERAKKRLFGDLRRGMPENAALNAMEMVPRELFVPKMSRHLSYEDIALPIGFSLPSRALPKKGTVSGFGGDIDDKESYFSITNYITPREIYQIDLTELLVMVLITYLYHMAI